MERIIVYGLSKQNVTAIMMIFKNTKATVQSPDVHSDFFDIVIGVLQGDILVPSIKKSFILKKKRREADDIRQEL